MSPAGAAANALQVLENEQVLEGLVSLWMQCLGNLTVSTAGLHGDIRGFSFHFCVTKSETFVLEFFLNKPVPSMKNLRCQRRLQATESLWLC